jgi:hypothetical protein
MCFVIRVFRGPKSLFQVYLLTLRKLIPDGIGNFNRSLVGNFRI